MRFLKTLLITVVTPVVIGLIAGFGYLQLFGQQINEPVGATVFQVYQGGTGVATVTGLLQGNGTSAFTGITNSSTAGQVLRVTGASTYAWGDLDLDDSDAITGTLGSTNIEDIYLFNSGDTATGLTIFSAGASVSTIFEVATYASSSAFLGSAFTSVGDCNDATEAVGWTTTGVFNCRAVQDLDATLTALAAYNTDGLLTQTAADTFTGRTLTGTTRTVSITNGSGVSGNPTFTIDTDFLTTNTSVSTKFESLTASVSNFRLQITTGGELGDCDAAGDTLNWDTTTGRFVCGTDGGGGVTSNSLDFDEFVASMSLDTFTDVTFGTQQYSFNLNSTGDFLIQDNGTTFATFNDLGDVAFANEVSVSGGFSVGAANSAHISSGGDLTFDGTGDYLVCSDCFAFRAQADEDAGLFFGQAIGTANRFQFLSATGTEFASFGADASVTRDFEVGRELVLAGISAGAAGDTDACLNATTNKVTDAGASSCIVSSRRFKENILPFTGGLDKVLQLNAVSYNYKPELDSSIVKNKSHIGLIAEDMLEVEPRLVFYEPDGKTPRGISYEEYTALLTSAIQELNEKVESKGYNSQSGNGNYGLLGLLGLFGLIPLFRKK